MGTLRSGLESSNLLLGVWKWDTDFLFIVLDRGKEKQVVKSGCGSHAGDSCDGISKSAVCREKRRPNWTAAVERLRPQNCTA